MSGKHSNKRRRSVDEVEPVSVAQEVEVIDDALLKRPKKTTADIQRKEIEKLMKNIDRPVEIDVSSRSDINAPREFVYNVKGSSSGASSNDFVKYQHLRRKEHQRIKTLEEEAAQDEAKQKYDEELHKLRQKGEEKTAKNRAKRQKRKKSKSTSNQK